MRWFLKLFGFYKVEYGYACGRHWMSINDKVIAATDDDDFYMPDDLVKSLVIHTIGAPEWSERDFGDSLPNIWED